MYLIIINDNSYHFIIDIHCFFKLFQDFIAYVACVEVI